MFLDFEIAADVLHDYGVRFPEDRAATNLAQWQVFERENPDTFAGVYPFWVQKAGDSGIRGPRCIGYQSVTALFL